jgi:hypothetical protein
MSTSRFSTTAIATFLSGFAVVTSLLGVPSPAQAGEKSGAGQLEKKAEKKRVTVDGTFERYVVSPRGDVVGIVLSNGAQVMFPPFANASQGLKKGDAIKIEAQQHVLTDGTIYTHPLVTKGTTVIVDASKKGPKGQKGKDAEDGKKAKLGAQTFSGTVSGFLLDPKGNHMGLLFSDGSVAMARSHEDLGALGVKKGDAVTVEGMGGSYALGRSVWVKSIKLPDGKVVKTKEQGKGKK